jgi:hypothetical protein
MLFRGFLVYDLSILWLLYLDFSSYLTESRFLWLVVCLSLAIITSDFLLLCTVFWFLIISLGVIKLKEPLLLILVFRFLLVSLESIFTIWVLENWAWDLELYRDVAYWCCLGGVEWVDRLQDDDNFFDSLITEVLYRSWKFLEALGDMKMFWLEQNI